ncbi:MAG TPA: hypothetical protein DDX14_09045, partial [Cyanobacteria bacterium UBA9579]|nr:hypothetical protein [Cyanobacteria bacterium UBA9579]
MPNNKIKTIIVFIIFLVSIVLLLTQFKNKSDKNHIHISCSRTIRPVVEKVANLYTQKYKQTIYIEDFEIDINAVNILSDKYDLAFTTKTNENPLLDHTTIGYDSLVIIVNSKNPLNELNKQTLNNIYTKKVKSWQEVTSWNEPILISSEKTGSNSARLFE